MSDQLGAAKSTYPVCPQSLPARELAEGRYRLRFARSADDLDAILRLRSEVFNLELEEGLDSSHETRRDLDRFDAVCHRSMVVEHDSGEVVGSYRIQTREVAAEHLGFYSQTEFDLSTLPRSVVDNAMEIGRACVARAHRSNPVLLLLWKGLALYVAANRRRFLFGCSSLSSQGPDEGKAFMDYLEERGHLHPELRIRPRRAFECYDEDFAGCSGLRVRVPPLFRTYLRHGALICGPPAIDRQFKTVDFLVLFDVDTMSREMFRTFFG